MVARTSPGWGADLPTALAALMIVPLCDIHKVVLSLLNGPDRSHRRVEREPCALIFQALDVPSGLRENTGYALHIRPRQHVHRHGHRGLLAQQPPADIPAPLEEGQGAPGPGTSIGRSHTSVSTALTPHVSGSRPRPPCTERSTSPSHGSRAPE